MSSAVSPILADYEAQYVPHLSSPADLSDMLPRRLPLTYIVVACAGSLVHIFEVPAAHLDCDPALVYYDWICTWNQELRWIWKARGRGNIASLLYILTRYPQIIQVIVTVSTINPITDQVRAILCARIT